MRIEAAGLTDLGCTRENNEEALLADAQAGVFLVAKGLGGQEAGEVASRMAVEIVAERLAAALKRPSQVKDLERVVVLAFEEANARILHFARQSPWPPGAGSTLVGLVRCGEYFVLANVGDSRAYQINGQTARQTSQDHGLTMAQACQALITPERTMRGPDNSIIPRALGIEPNLEVDTRIILGAPDEVFLLCSDGLGNVLASQDILDILSNNYGEAPRDTCGRLIALAHERQARDKVSVVLVRCLD